MVFTTLIRRFWHSLDMLPVLLVFILLFSGSPSLQARERTSPPQKKHAKKGFIYAKVFGVEMQLPAGLQERRMASGNARMFRDPQTEVIWVVERHAIPTGTQPGSLAELLMLAASKLNVPVQSRPKKLSLGKQRIAALSSFSNDKDMAMSIIVSIYKNYVYIFTVMAAPEKGRSRQAFERRMVRTIVFPEAEAPPNPEKKNTVMQPLGIYLPNVGHYAKNVVVTKNMIRVIAPDKGYVFLVNRAAAATSPYNKMSGAEIFHALGKENISVNAWGQIKLAGQPAYRYEVSKLGSTGRLERRVYYVFPQKEWVYLFSGISMLDDPKPLLAFSENMLAGIELTASPHVSAESKVTARR